MAPYKNISLACDWNTLQVWLPVTSTNEEKLIAQVVYLPIDPKPLCAFFVESTHHLSFQDQFVPLFTKATRSALTMIQALQFAMTSSTTQIRPHFSKSMDISTLEDSQVLSAFPYDIRFLDLSPEDANDFGLNPLLPVQSSLGIHATVMDSADRAGLDPLDFGKGGKSRRESSKGKGKKGKGKGKAHTNAPLYKGRKDDRDDRDDWRDDTPDRSWSKNWNNNRWFTNDGSTQSQGHKSSASKWDKGQQRSSHVALVCRLCLTCHWLLGFNLNCHECTGAGATTYFEELVAAGCKVSPDPSPPIPPMECPFGDPPCSTFLGHGACAVCRHLQSLWLRFARHNNDPPLDFLREALQLALEHRIHGVLKWDTDKSLWDHTYSWIDEVTYDMTAPAPHFTFLRDLTRECYEESWPLPCEPSGACYAWKPWTPDRIEQGDWTNFGSLASATYDQTSLTLECFKNALVQYITKWLDNNGFWTTFEFLYPGAEVNLLATNDMIPWDALIAFSWHLACEESRAWNNHWNQANLKVIYKATLQDYTGPPSEWAAEQFVQSILEDQEFLAIFLGQEPHVNQRLAKLSASASYLTDTCYWQIAHLFGVLTTGKQQKQLPNDELAYLWNLIADLVPNNHPSRYAAQSGKQRHWNNKGNSMEILLLLMFENSHSAFWTILLVLFYMQHHRSNYSWKINVY